MSGRSKSQRSMGSNYSEFTEKNDYSREIENAIYNNEDGDFFKKIQNLKVASNKDDFELNVSNNEIKMPDLKKKKKIGNLSKGIENLPTEDYRRRSDSNQTLQKHLHLMANLIRKVGCNSIRDVRPPDEYFIEDLSESKSKEEEIYFERINKMYENKLDHIDRNNLHNHITNKNAYFIYNNPNEIEVIKEEEEEVSVKRSKSLSVIQSKDEFTDDANSDTLDGKSIPHLGSIEKDDETFSKQSSKNNNFESENHSALKSDSRSAQKKSIISPENNLNKKLNNSDRKINEVTEDKISSSNLDFTNKFNTEDSIDYKSKFERVDSMVKKNNSINIDTTITPKLQKNDISDFVDYIKDCSDNNPQNYEKNNDNDNQVILKENPVFIHTKDVNKYQNLESLNKKTDNNFISKEDAYNFNEDKIFTKKSSYVTKPLSYTSDYKIYEDNMDYSKQSHFPSEIDTIKRGSDYIQSPHISDNNLIDYANNHKVFQKITGENFFEEQQNFYLQNNSQDEIQEYDHTDQVLNRMNYRFNNQDLRNQINSVRESNNERQNQQKFDKNDTMKISFKEDYKQYNTRGTYVSRKEKMRRKQKNTDKS